MTETATEVRERPILFSGKMVRAILDGRKTVTRRVVKGCQDLKLVERGNPRDPGNWYVESTDGCIYTLAPNSLADGHFRCPYGSPGNRMWVRETHYIDDDDRLFYRADKPRGWIEEPGGRWRPSIHMPKWASRIALEITEVRAERVQEITPVDAIAEGIERHDDDGVIYYGPYGKGHSDPVFEFHRLWDSINAKRGHSWESDPWVWVVSFQRIDP